MFAMIMLLAGGIATAQVTITISDPIISSTAPGFASYFDSQLRRGAARAEQDLGELIGENVTVLVGGRQGRGIGVSAIVNDSPEYSAMVLQMTDARSGAASDPFSYSSGWDDNLHRTISKALIFLYLSTAGVSDTGAAQPAFLAEISTVDITTQELGFDGSVSPWGLATDSHGDLLVAGNSTIVRFDRYFREQAKLPPPPRSNEYAWAGRLAVSPADMVYTQAVAGGDVWAFAPDVLEGRRIRTASSSAASLAVMEDGSVILHDQMNQTTSRIRDTERQELNLKSGQYSYIFAITGGPDNTVWTWDVTTRMAVISDPNGIEIDVIIPVLPMNDAVTVRAMATYPNGDLLLATPTKLFRINSDGLVVWAFSLSDHPDIGTLQSISAVAFDDVNGLIYLSEPTQQRVIQILDVEYARSAGALSAEEEELIALDQRGRRSSRSAEVYAARAEIFEQQDALLPAMFGWSAAVSADPNNVQYAAAVERVELRIEIETARKAVARARRTAESIGAATARSEYMSALALYEQILAKDPGNREVAREMDQIIEEIEEPLRPRERNPFPLTVTELAMSDVFPSLSLYYRINPIGFATIRNELEIPVSNVGVTLEMSIMDFPTTSEPVAELPPGESITVPLFVRLSERVLSQRGRLLVQPQITVEYDAGSERYSVSETTEIFAHGNTAITWDDSRKLAAFIMPNEKIASDFASRNAAVGNSTDEIDLSVRLFRAMKLIEAVGSIGIQYIEDPLSGISDILGQANVVDSVRFPRDTLRVEAGDCDDTTALLCTLYEATGISTAIMTSPGHVFLAFDTGEPTQNAWLFESDSTVAISYGATVWLPLETTILDQGFVASWEEGSRLWSRYNSGNQIEFLPVAEARALYEPIPTGDGGFDIRDIDDPTAAGAEGRYNDSIAAVTEKLYTANVARLERGLSSQSDRQKLRTLNQLGVLHARFAEPREAERSFERAIALDADYTASYVNLANLKLIGSRPQEAIALLGEVTERRPESVLANLLLAQAHQMLGDTREVQEYMVLVENQAPELAAQYPELTGAGTGRASEAQSKPILPWPVD